MEIYRQTVNTVEFEAPDATTIVNASIRLNDGTPFSVPVVGNSNNDGSRMRYITIPYVENEGTVHVEWSFSGSTLTETDLVSGPTIVKDSYEVVTPILSRRELREILEDESEYEVTAVEAAVRHIINAHTGQTFGRFVGAKEVRGSGASALSLPGRLLSISNVDGNLAGTDYHIVGDGFYLRYYPWGVPPVKADAYGLHMHVGGVIHNPNNVKLQQFSPDVVYKIEGVWGYEEVPTRVKEAAKLLVNDYSCADSAYRDRYLTSMTAADWRIQFNDGAFAKTGNVRADQLLADFVLQRGWAVL